MQGKIDNNKALKYITASDGRNTFFSLKSLKTGKHFTYRVNKAEPKEGQSDTFFVSYLNGPDNWYNYQYLGIIVDGKFRTTAKSRAGADAPVAKAIAWTVTKLAEGEDISEDVQVWHEGKCGVCGAKLTHPDSIAAGYGPDHM